MFARPLVFVFVVLAMEACGRSPADHAQPAQPATTSSQGSTAPAPVAARSGDDSPSIEPADLARQLDAAQAKPLLFHVGFRKLYEQAHIPGSEYLGPGSEDAALARLRERVAALPHDTPIVVYCGCCPWEHCPNVKPAYQLLHDLGFTNAKMLSIPHNFGDDWVEKHFPVATGP